MGLSFQLPLCVSQHIWLKHAGLGYTECCLGGDAGPSEGSPALPGRVSLQPSFSNLCRGCTSISPECLRPTLGLDGLLCFRSSVLYSTSVRHWLPWALLSHCCDVCVCTMVRSQLSSLRPSVNPTPAVWQWVHRKHRMRLFGVISSVSWGPKINGGPTAVLTSQPAHPDQSQDGWRFSLHSHWDPSACAAKGYA